MNALPPSYEWRSVSHTAGLTSSTIRSMSAGAVLDGDVYLFGGKGVGLLSSLWKFDRLTGHWEELNAGGCIPGARDGHTLTPVPAPEFPYDFVTIGGQQAAKPPDGDAPKKMSSKVKTVLERNLVGDMYGYNAKKNEWTRLDPPVVPPVRRGHSVVLWNRSGVDARMVEEPKRRKIMHGEEFDEDEEEEIYKKKCAKYKKDVAAAALDNMALILYGGSGIDPMRGEEKILNDTWEYFFRENTWRIIPTTGPRPAGNYNHAAALVGNDMIVTGGITPPKFNEPEQKGPQGALGAHRKLAPTSGGVHVLNLSTRTWSFVPLTTPEGNHFPFSLHGHCLASAGGPGKLFMYGGRESIAANATAKSPLPKRSRRGRTRRMSAGNPPGYELFVLDMNEGTVCEVESRGVAPEDRFGHVMLTVPEWHPREKRSVPVPPLGQSKKAAPKREGGQPLLLVYGGNRTGEGGYCHNEVYELFYDPQPRDVRSVSIEGVAVGEAGLDNENSMELEEGMDDRGGLEGGTKSFISVGGGLGGGPPGSPTSPGSRPLSPGSTVHSQLSMGTFQSKRQSSVLNKREKTHKPETLWVKSLRPILGPPLSGKPASPSNFQELKMALSYPLSGKVEEEGSQNGDSSPKKDGHGHGHGRHGGEFASDTDSLTSDIEDNPFPKGSSDWKKRHQKNLMKKSQTLAPLMKGLNINTARDVYDGKYGSPVKKSPSKTR